MIFLSVSLWFIFIGLNEQFNLYLFKITTKLWTQYTAKLWRNATSLLLEASKQKTVSAIE